MNKYELESDERNIKESLINDQIKNSEYLQCLIKLLQSITNNQIICIDGDWGVGKTFLVREYAKILYPKEAFIRLDMSEYVDKSSVSRIVGSNPGYVGYEDKNTILERIKNNPYCVILLDEIEKANASVMKLFLQVLDEGYMTSSNGEKIDFSNAVIFMTSNLGCDKNSIGFINNKHNIVLDKIKDFLGVELVNRIDKIVIFNNLSSKNIDRIILNRLKEFNKNIDYSSYLDSIKSKINYNDMGARGIDRIINEELKDVVG